MKTKFDPEIIRHSAAHVLAAAVLEMFPETKFGMGPATEDGFFYDFELPRTLIPEDLPLLEEKMKNIIATNHPFEREEISLANAREHFQRLGQHLKVEIIDDLAKEGKEIVSVYKTGPFVDLCVGPHVESTGELKAEGIKLMRASGAYWKSDENRQQLQRIYGVAFETKNQLEKYLHLREEAEKRDHKKLGKELGLFVFSKLVGPGLPLYTPKGATVRREIQDYSNQLRQGIGYQEVHTPQINKAELFKISGHYDLYKDDMFRVSSNYTEEEYFMKPMNCPQHTQLYAAEMRSYRDLPVRIADFANLHRDEKPGQLGGLTRLRSFSQDDGHCFCREDQIEQEFEAILGCIKEAMATYGMKYHIRLSLRDEAKKDQYLGSDVVWEKSQSLLKKILEHRKIKHVRAEGEAAFYGPKMDLIAEDSLGREWQLSTIQLDFNMPVRFGLEYIDEAGKKQVPVMIHSAIVGSPERFMGVLIEHYAGNFPLWLSPMQVAVIPVSDKFSDYAATVKKELASNGIRVETNEKSESLGKRISETIEQRIPYLVVVGEKEVADRLVAVRTRGSREQETLPLSTFIEKIQNEISKKS
ncbi:threonine--tRNA ligase [Patescibacteria group bacterium]|nr:MAG: threonine--tRNA ligase [Patescibacteria group bacterium]